MIKHNIIDIKTCIILECKVYEAVVTDSELPCNDCVFNNKCKGSLADYANLCMNFDSFTGSDGTITNTVFKEWTEKQ